MEKLRGSGQITLIDLNDARQLVSYIGSRLQRQVIYNPNDNSYLPNYSEQNQVLTPQLFVAGTTEDIAKDALSIKWFYQFNSTGNIVEITKSNLIHEISETMPTTLTIKTNLFRNYMSLNYICEIKYLDEETQFTIDAKSSIELFKITNGSDGTDGTDGRNAIMGVLSNESHSIPTDSDGTNGNYTGANTTLTIYNGNQDDSSNWVVTAVATDGIVGSLTDRTYTVTDMTVDIGTVTFTARKDGSADIVKVFNISKNKMGLGKDATSYWLNKDASIIIKSVETIEGVEEGEEDTEVITFEPENITFTGRSQTGTNAIVNQLGRFVIKETVDNLVWETKYTSSVDESSVTYTLEGDMKSIKVLFYRSDLVTLLDEETVPVIIRGSNGVDAITGILSNESHSVPTDYLGNRGNYIGANTTLTILMGALDVNEYYNFSAVPSSGVVGGLVGSTYTVTNMTVDTGFVNITATNKMNSETKITKTFTITKNKQGFDGTDSISYWMNANASAVALDGAGNYTPSDLTFTGFKQTGIVEPVAYKGRFIVQEKIGTASWVTKYTSTANESTVTYIPNKGISAVRVQFYYEGGTTIKLDEQVIPIVKDGSNPIRNVLTTPDGNTIKNSSGSLIVQSNAFKGSDEIYPNELSWYSKNETAKGDNISGAGWDLIGKVTNVDKYENLIPDTSKFTNRTANGWRGWQLATISFPTTGDKVNVKAVKTSTTQQGIACPNGLNAISGETYTVSFKARGNYETLQACIIGTPESFLIKSWTSSPLSETEFKTFTHTFINTSDNQSMYLAIIGYAPTGGWIEVEGQSIIFTKGDGVPSWRPSLEDGVSWNGTAIVENNKPYDYINNKLIVYPTAIDNIQTIQSVIKYDAVHYKDFATVVDLSDPIQVQIIGITIFKNGQGSIDYTAKMYKNGMELDALGTDGYTYSWNMYDRTNTVIPNWNKSGKKITVSALDFDSEANLQVRITK